MQTSDRNKEFAHGLNKLIEDFVEHLGISPAYAASLLELKAAELRSRK